MMKTKSWRRAMIDLVRVICSLLKMLRYLNPHAIVSPLLTDTVSLTEKLLKDLTPVRPKIPS